MRVFAQALRAVSVQTQVNVFGRTDGVLDAARRGSLGVLARSLPAMGLLTGRYDAVRRPAEGDLRLDTPWWDYFDEATMPQWLDRVASELLTSGGRTLVQGSLCYLLALGTVPIPGARTPEQAVENADALRHGPLDDEVVAEIETLLAHSPERRP